MPKKRKSCLSANPWRKRKLLRKLETHEQRALRLEKDRKRTANRRAHETEEEREERLARNREAARSRRANAKQSKRSAQRKVAVLEEHYDSCRSNKTATHQTLVKLQEPLRRRVVGKQKTDKNFASRRHSNKFTGFSAGGCTVQNQPLFMMQDQQNLAYEALLGNEFLHSQLQNKLLNRCPKTPELILQLGLKDCSPEFGCNNYSEVDCSNHSERSLTEDYDDENNAGLGVECEVTIEVDQKSSCEQESLAGDKESLTDVNNSKEETV